MLITAMPGTRVRSEESVIGHALHRSQLPQPQLLSDSPKSGLFSPNSLRKRVIMNQVPKRVAIHGFRSM